MGDATVKINKLLSWGNNLFNSEREKCLRQCSAAVMFDSLPLTLQARVWLSDACIQKGKDSPGIRAWAMKIWIQILFCGLGKPSEVELTFLDSTWLGIKALVSSCVGSISTKRERRALLEGSSCPATSLVSTGRVPAPHRGLSLLCLKPPCSSTALLPSQPCSCSFLPWQCPMSPAATLTRGEKWANTNLAKNMLSNPQLIPSFGLIRGHLCSQGWGKDQQPSQGAHAISMSTLKSQIPSSANKAIVYDGLLEKN